MPVMGSRYSCSSPDLPLRYASHFPSLLIANVETPSLASVILRASPPSGRMRYSWFCVALADGASRLDANTKNDPSRDHRGDVSFLSCVKVSWRVDDTPRSSDTTWISVCRFASFQSGVDTVYSSHLPSGLGVGDDTCLMCCMSRKVMGRFAGAGAWAKAAGTRSVPPTRARTERMIMEAACAVSFQNARLVALAGGANMKRNGKDVRGPYSDF